MIHVLRAIEKLTELDSLYKASSQMGKDYKSKRLFWVYDLANVEETRRLAITIIYIRRKNDKPKDHTKFQK